MRQLKRYAPLAALLLASCQVESAPPAITVDDAWARATLPGQTSVAVYLTVKNAGGADRLIDVSSPAGNASVHSTSMADGVMRMRALEFVEIPANSTAALEPGGTHVMVTNLKQPLTEGATFPLELKFDRSGDRQVSVTVRPASTEGAHM